MHKSSGKICKYHKYNLEKLGLELAPHKTHLVHFNKQETRPKQLTIRVGNNEISSTESVRYLGITLDYRLSFKLHRENVKKNV